MDCYQSITNQVHENNLFIGDLLDMTILEEEKKMKLSTESYIRKEIIRIIDLPFHDGSWVYSELDKMTTNALEMLNSGKAKNVDTAIFMTIDKYF